MRIYIKYISIEYWILLNYINTHKILCQIKEFSSNPSFPMVDSYYDLTE